MGDVTDEQLRETIEDALLHRGVSKGYLAEIERRAESRGRAEGAAKRADEVLRALWRELCDDASPAKMAAAKACVRFAHAIGALSDDARELWARRIETCPGHDDDGGRAWCAYCGDLERGTHGPKGGA